MKKKIEIEIPSYIGIEGETKSTREQATQRRLEAVTNAIAKRTKTAMPTMDKFLVTELQAEKLGKGESKGIEGQNKERKMLSVELDLTQKQINGLPVGLKKLLK